MHLQFVIRCQQAEHTLLGSNHLFVRVGTDILQSRKLLQGLLNYTSAPALQLQQLVLRQYNQLPLSFKQTAIQHPICLDSLERLQSHGSVCLELHKVKLVVQPKHHRLAIEARKRRINNHLLKIETMGVRNDLLRRLR